MLLNFYNSSAVEFHLPPSEVQDFSKKNLELSMFDKLAVQRSDDLSYVTLAENIRNECSNVGLEDMNSNYLLGAKPAGEYYELSSPSNLS